MSELIQQVCPSCGGHISFSASEQMVVCPYCESKFDISVFGTEEKPEASDGSWKRGASSVWKDDETDKVRLYVCTSCGGEIMTEVTTAAATCPYCSNPVVMKDQFAVARPDAVIPFKTSREQAMATLKDHIKKHKFAHRSFGRENRLDEIKGVYVPYWFFSADADADFEFKCENIRTWSDRKYNYTETSHYFVRRVAGMSFGDIPADGSKKLDDAISESIEPFDMREAVPFEAGYLAGFMADRYDVSWEDDLPLVTQRIKNSAESAVMRNVRNYTVVRKQKGNVDVTPGTVKYILCPVWLLNSTYRGKKYTFAMNGQTGAFVGDLPLDIGYFLMNMGITALPIAVILYLVAMYLL